MANDLNTFLLGKDCKMIADVNGYVELDIENGDIKANTYTENIRNALNRRLFSIIDDLVLHPGYGGVLVSYVSDLVTLRYVNLLKIILRAEILKDPRVESVSSLDITLSKPSRTLVFTYSVITITNQNINNIVFEIPVSS